MKNYPSFAGGVIFCAGGESLPALFSIVKKCARENKNGYRRSHAMQIAFSKINFLPIKYNDPAFRGASQKQGYGARLRHPKNPVSMIVGAFRLGWS